MSASDGAKKAFCLPGEIADGLGSGVSSPQQFSGRQEPTSSTQVEEPPNLLDEFATELEALLKEQHHELRSRLQDFVEAQKTHVAGAVNHASNSDGEYSLGVYSLGASALRDAASREGEHAQVVGAHAEGFPTSKTGHRELEDDDDWIGPAMDQVFRVSNKSGDVLRRASVELANRGRKDNDVRAKLLRLTGHWVYEFSLAVLIFLNAIVIAWETDSNASAVSAGRSSDPAHFQVLMCIFCVLFAIDIALRLAAQRMLFFYSLDWKWNWFDFVVVGLSIFEVFVSLLDLGNSWLSSASTLRVVRIVRLVRVARIGRALRSFMYLRDLRMTISMLVDSVIPTITFALIMCVIVMVFAIFLTDGVTMHIDAGGSADDELIKYFGNLLSTMFTLYMAVFGGIDWESAYEPLMILSRIYRVTFVGYVFFVLLAALNVLSAMFVDNTLQRSKSDRDFVVQTELEGKREFLRTMEHLFEELDPDRSGTIRLHELQAHIMDPQVNAFFQAIDLNVFKVKELFNLIDVNKSGGIDRSEFVQGCSRLKGEAKELDVAILQYEVKSLSEETQKVVRMLRAVQQRLEEGPTEQPRIGRRHSAFD